MLGELKQAISMHDPEVAALIAAEDVRQQQTICLIPSENYASKYVLAALATSFTNKYSEGYPYRWQDGDKVARNGRYYQGQANTDALEHLAMQRALDLFTPNPERYHANVQPLSGSPANLAVLNACLEPGDTFMGLSLQHGGHLTHGHNVSVTGRYYQAFHYHLNDDEVINYAEVRALAEKHRPKLIFCGATAYPLIIDFAQLGEIAKAVGALLVADVSHINGLCIAGQHPHPFPHADVLTTTTHKMLRGPRAGLIICRKELGEAIDRSVFPGLQGGPHMNTITSMAIALQEAATESYQAYATQIVKNAKRLAQTLQQAGFRLVGGGTENHLLLIDAVQSAENVRSKSGGYLAARLEKAGIIVNKNTLPGDDKPWLPTGIRIGTPAVTTLGMVEQDMEVIANWITRVAGCKDDDGTLLTVKQEVESFMAAREIPEAFAQS